ncbi:MAG: hypothetical protein HY898_26810 [Deltaproteobacteria bacterium]|nr:hypothetical protein [Deltaproteobacteria bacterium]
MNARQLGMAWMIGAGLVAGGCSGSVDFPGDDGHTGGAMQPGAGGSGASSHTYVEGIPCSYLHGKATLSDYNGDNYAASAFSFEFASQDSAVTHNEFELLYEVDLFLVNLVTDDVSFIVDLGQVALDQVPPSVEPDKFPVGNWGEHDALQAQLGHTYFVRSVDSAGRGVAAFRVIGIEPGKRVTIEWERSTDDDVMVVPAACGL